MDTHCYVRRTGQPRRWLSVMMALFAILVVPMTQARAQLSVLPGWDLWTTTAGTTFAGVPFVGVPLVTFDFGGPIGVQNVGATDTIVQRLAPAVVPGPVPPTQAAPPIRIEMVALQLMSAVPVDFGLGVGIHYITLQSARGGPASVGEMIIRFDNTNVPPPVQPQNGTFDSFFDVFFDVRLGGLNGPIALSDMLPLSSQGNAWSHFPDPNELLINGVNNLLNGQNRLGDFHPIGTVDEAHPTGAHHVVEVTSLSAAPEPGSVVFLIVGLGLLGTPLLRLRK